MQVEFEDVVAFDSARRPVTATVTTGQVLGVVGASDVGTRAFVRAVAGRKALMSGTVYGMPEVDRQVWIPQDHQLAMTLTALENVVVPGLAGGGDPDVAVERAQSALRDVGLDQMEDRLIEELSGGQQQRVAVARALAQPGEILLAEDPASALDAVNRRRVLRLLRDQAQERFVLIATSTVDQLEDVADVVIDLDAP